MIFVPVLPTSVNSRLIRTNRGNFVLSPRYRQSKDEVQCYFTERWKGEPVQGYIRVTIVFMLKSGKVWDIDNHAKSVLDAAKGIAFADDNQIAELELRKVYNEDEGFMFDVTPVSIYFPEKTAKKTGKKR